MDGLNFEKNGKSGGSQTEIMQAVIQFAEEVSLISDKSGLNINASVIANEENIRLRTEYLNHFDEKHVEIIDNIKKKTNSPRESQFIFLNHIYKSIIFALYFGKTRDLVRVRRYLNKFNRDEFWGNIYSESLRKLHQNAVISSDKTLQHFLDQAIAEFDFMIPADLSAE